MKGLSDVIVDAPEDGILFVAVFPKRDDKIKCVSARVLRPSALDEVVAEFVREVKKMAVRA